MNKGSIILNAILASWLNQFELTSAQLVGLKLNPYQDYLLLNDL